MPPRNASVFLVLLFTLTLAGCKSPVATPKQYFMLSNSSVDVLLEASNTPTSYSIVSVPLHGTVAGTGPTVNYMPTKDFVGLDSFTFTASNQSGVSSPATISLVIIPNVEIDTFSADRLTISIGESTNIRWVAQGADQVEIAPGVGEVPTFGSMTVTPTQDTEYVLTASNSLSTITARFTINVEPQSSALPEPPYIKIPAGRTYSSQPTFSWNPVKDAINYQFELFDSTQDIRLRSETIANTTIEMNEPLNMNHLYKWRVRGNTVASNGEYSAWASFYYPGFNLNENLLKILEPTSLVALDNYSATVIGEITEPGSVVFVNHKEACVHEGRFYINEVFVNRDKPMVSAVAQLVGGPKITKETQVTFPSDVNPWVLSLDYTCGDAPLTTGFTLESNSVLPLSIGLDIGNDGTQDYVETEMPFRFQHTFDDAGVFQVLATFTAKDGKIYRQKYYVVSYDKRSSNYENNLYYQRTWAGFVNQLQQGNTDNASHFLSNEALVKYGPILNVIKSNLYSIESQVTPLVLSKQDKEFRDYVFLRTTNGTTKAFIVSFFEGKIVSL